MGKADRSVATVRSVEQPGVVDGLLAGQLQAIAAQLWAIAAEQARAAVRSAGPAASGQAAYQTSRDLLIATTELEYHGRRARDGLFNPDLFGEPAWDMLLYLFAAQLRGELVVTSSLIRAAAVPPTTALRWIAQLEQAGLIERCTIKRDGRLRVQRLTRPAFARLEQYFRARLGLGFSGLPLAARTGPVSGEPPSTEPEGPIATLGV